MLPLSKLLWDEDGEWSKARVFVANAIYAWETVQEEEIGSEDQQATSAEDNHSRAFKVSKL